MTTTTVTPVLEGRGLTKRFGNVTAIENADFELLPGEILAVIGDNGATAERCSDCDARIPGLVDHLVGVESPSSTANLSTSRARSTPAPLASKLCITTLPCRQVSTLRRTCISVVRNANPGSWDRCSGSSIGPQCRPTPASNSAN